MLEERGNLVECVCSKTGFWFDELKNKYGFVMHEIGFTRLPLTLSNLKGLKQLYKLQKSNHYDLIYCQQPVGGLMGRLLAKKFKIPVIYTVHGFHFYDGCSLKRKLIYKNAEKFLSRFTDTIITVNDEDFNYASKMHAKNVFKINGIGMKFDKYQPCNENKEEIKKSLGINENDYVITTVAEFIYRKNYATMIRVAKKLKDEGFNFKYLICGRGKYEKKIKKQISKLGLENEIKLLGYRKDINRILLASDLFFLASFHEGLTLSVVEAMYFGLPCVVSNIRGNRDLIDNGFGGFLVAPKDVKKFAFYIKEICNSNKLQKEMRKHNMEKSKQYSIDFVSSQLKNIYDNCNFKI